MLPSIESILRGRIGQRCVVTADTELEFDDGLSIRLPYLATTGNAPTGQVREAAEGAEDSPEELLREVALSGVEFDDERMGYVVVQINRVTWEQIRAWRRLDRTGIVPHTPGMSNAHPERSN